MKKLLTAAMAVSLVASLAVSASAIADEERDDVIVYRNTPTIDGTVNPGEWDQENALVITPENGMLWGGDEINNIVYFYYSWDDTGLYLAADVSDAEVLMSDDPTAVYSKDAFQIALDPGGLIGDDEGAGAMFFSIGPIADGTLGAVYHPYGQGAGDPFDYKGAYTKTAGGWQFEMIIPWTSIEILGGDGYAWTHGDGQVINALLCVLDREEGVENNYQITKTGAVTFAPADYPLELQLSTYVAPSLDVEEPAAGETVEGEAADAPVAAPTADAGIVAAAAVMAIAAGVVLSKKN